MINMEPNTNQQLSMECLIKAKTCGVGTKLRVWDRGWGGGGCHRNDRVGAMFECSNILLVIILMQAPNACLWLVLISSVHPPP